MIKSIVDVGAALEFTGGFHFAQYFRPSVAVTAQRWQDFSIAGGLPIYNPYVGSPLVFTRMQGVGNRGIYHGEDVLADQNKKLMQIRLQSVSASAPASFILCDYIGFYPLIDFADAELQEMDNTDLWTRYGNNEGVQMALVCAAPTSISSTVTINYLDTDGALNNTTVFTNVSSLAQIQNSKNSATTTGIAPWITLGSGSKGVQRVVSVQSDGLGDGFAHIVIIKPLGTVVVHETLTPNEVNFINDKMTLPDIKNDAYLNFFGMMNATGNATLRGELIFIRG